MVKAIFGAITKASIRLRWLTILVVVALLVTGVYSATKLRQELLPPIDFPQVFVFAQQPGASSEDLRDLVSIPLENAVIAIPGVIKDGLQSTTTSGFAFVGVAYEYGLNPTDVQAKIQAAIDSVVNAGLPKGLKTTADLTPDIVRTALTKAPSLWKHFDSNQLLALSPDVLDAALAVNPDFAAQIDPLTRNQLAAERVNRTLGGQAAVHPPAALPGAWIVTDDTVPKIHTFSINSLPITIASVAATSANLSSDQLKALVAQQIVDPLTKGNAIPGVADVSVSGGQQIPDDVHQQALNAVTNQQASTASNSSSNSGSGNAATPSQPSAPTGNSGSPNNPPAANNPLPTPPQTDANGVPLLPNSWRSFLATPLLTSMLHVSTINTVADLLTAVGNAAAAGEGRARSLDLLGCYRFLADAFNGAQQRLARAVQ